MATMMTSRYTVWCEYKSPDCDFMRVKKGIYTSIEEAQIGLKFSLKGGEYAEMILEGKDITPSIKGTARTCSDIKYYDTFPDDPARLYIWAKDMDGNTERLSINQHNYPTSRLYTLPLACAKVMPAEGTACDAGEHSSNASDSLSALTSGTTTPESIETPLTSAPGSPDGASDKVQQYTMDNECLSAKLYEAREQQDIQAQIDEKRNMQAAVDAFAVQSVISYLEKSSKRPSKKTTATAGSGLKIFPGPATIANVRSFAQDDAGYDGSSEVESESSTLYESDFDSISVLGMKDGRSGSRLAYKIKLQSRKRLFCVLRRLRRHEA